MSGTSDTKIRKRKKWPIVAGAVAAVLAVGIIGTTLTVKPASAADSGYQEAFVEKGSIVNTVVGSGTLEYGDTIDIKAPTGIKIDEVLVEEGERVQDGQALAT